MSKIRKSLGEKYEPGECIYKIETEKNIRSIMTISSGI
jgi:hypothetical protein